MRKAYYNRAAFEKTRFSSKSVSILSYLAHQLVAEGTYLGKIYSGREVIDEFKLECTSHSSNTQVDVNLADFELNKFPALRGNKSYEVGKDGYLVLYDSKNNGDYRLQLEKAGTGKGSKVKFDTAKLSKGDIYATTLLRPGKYEVSMAGSKETMGLEVILPEKFDLKERRNADKPVQVRVGEKGFSQKRTKVYPGQGLVFSFETRGSIDIKLKKAFDKEQPLRPVVGKVGKRKKKGSVKRRKRWTNPKYM